MQSPRHFGTDGLRGKANEGLLTPERVLALGRALGRLSRRRGGPLATARDPRRSSPLLQSALQAGAASEGAEVLDLGVLPTPGLAALLPDLQAGVGAMVSASHNPMPDNGIKVLSGDGSKLDDRDEVWLEEQMEIPPQGSRTGGQVGAIRVLEDARERYIAHLLRAFPGLRLDGMRVVVDAANGACSAAAPDLFERLGASVIRVAADPDGLNINDGCGAVHPEAMARAVVEHTADVGVAFDGDGDRLMMATADGSIQDGDRVMFVCAAPMRDKGLLRGGTVVGTVMTNFGLELALRDLGLKLVRTPVGDRHVAHRLRDGGYGLGGEPSGHIIFGEQNRFIGDGLFSALYVLSVIRETGCPLGELSSGMKAVPQRLENVRVASKPPLDELAGLRERVRQAESSLAGSGRVLVRYSGTENLLRVMVEGADAAEVDRWTRELVAAARAEIGASP